MATDLLTFSGHFKIIIRTIVLVLKPISPKYIYPKLLKYQETTKISTLPFNTVRTTQKNCNQFILD